MPKKVIKKKIVDIIRPIPIKQKIDEDDLKKLGKNLERIDKKVEKFEEREEKQFKKENKIKNKRKFSLKTYIILGLSLTLLIAAIYSAIEFLPRAKIQIVTKKNDWSYVNSIIADGNITKIDVIKKQIPAEIFLLRKNFNFSFPATGKRSVEKKASGKIIIYNAYSSNSQVLVANTRLLTPDGKIFHLEKRIVVPGAKISEGKIIPSNIDAVVIADQAGPDYNIGPVNRFSIPGFQGSEKYQGFYGQSEESMSGGFIGEEIFPNEEDIKKARAKALESLRGYNDSSLSLQIQSEFKIIEGSKDFNVLKEEINQNVDEKGNFTFFLEAQSSVIVFKEQDLKNLIEDIAKTNLGVDFRIKNYKLEYGAGRADFKQGKISFAVNFQGSFYKPVDIDNFKKQILNKTEGELKSLVYSSSNIEKTMVSFWPFWVKKVPNDLNRIKVEVE